MTISPKPYLSMFRIKTAEQFQYRTAAFIGATTGIFWVLIEITVYIVFYTYANNKSAGLLAGMSLKQVITYSWLSQFLFMIQPGLDGEIVGRITSGDVGIELCRPIDMYLHWFARLAASRLSPMCWRGAIVLSAGILIPGTYGISPPASFEGFLCMLASFISAFLLTASFSMLIHTIRLGITWGDGPIHMLTLLGDILSGAYLPLQLWPHFMQKFLLAQPFAGYLDIMLRFYIGTLHAGDAIWAISLQLAWTVLFIMAGRRLMTRKLKRIIIQGG